MEIEKSKKRSSDDDKNYSIVTTKLDVDDSEFVPKQDRVSFTQ